jgi:hypothetical protein
VLWIALIFGVRGMLKLRRRLPPAWARGSPEDRFLYLAPLYLAVAMVGFAVSSFFVSFAWMDPVYYLAADGRRVFVVSRRLAAATPAGPVAVPVRGRAVGGTRPRQVPPHRSR